MGRVIEQCYADHYRGRESVVRGACVVLPQKVLAGILAVPPHSSTMCIVLHKHPSICLATDVFPAAVQSVSYCVSTDLLLQYHRMLRAGKIRAHIVLYAGRCIVANTTMEIDGHIYM